MKVSLEEQKQRGVSDLKKRDQHIAELSRRNKELLAAAKRAEPEVVPVISDGAGEEGKAKESVATESISSKGRKDSFGDDASIDRDMPTLAALRQRLYPKRNTRQEAEPETPRRRASRSNGKAQNQRTPRAS